MVVDSLKNYGSVGHWHLYCLSLFVSLTCIDGATHNVAYFNSSLGSHVNVSSVLNFRSLLGFSFRTCSSGQLISQSGSSGDYFEILLTMNGSLIVNWGSRTISDSEEVDSLNLSDNEWYTVGSNFFLGDIRLKVEQGSAVKASVLLSNSTFRSNLWNLNLTNGSPVEVGGQFSGCIQEGPQILLSDSTTTSSNVDWDQCSLDATVGCGSTIKNPCWDYPCENEGNCIYSGFGSNYSCQCPRTFTGSRCEVDLSSQGCDLSPCQNGGTCQSSNATARHYSCLCAPGYIGTDCEINKNECASNPCRNGGLCKDGINSFSCNCTATGYTGTLCQTNINECTGSVLCLNGATCMDTPGSYKCVCPLGFVGTNCQNRSNDCLSNPCLHSSTCYSNISSYVCRCALGYNGVNCESNIDDCIGFTCPGDHSICVDGINSFTCNCLPGYYDPNNVTGNVTACEDVDECLSNPCATGSTCVDGINNYTCQCRAGYTDRSCQTDIDECLSSPCQNGANCSNLVNGYSCICTPGFTGLTCSTEIDQCALGTTCLNGATCISHVARVECICAPGWSGEVCQFPIDECKSKPCQNGGSCKDYVNSYNCTCLPGFTGVNCEVNINDCSESLCLNNGTCVDEVNRYSCRCTDDWMGQNCSMVYNPCLLNVCKNNATCESNPPSHNYNCTCPSGFTGHDCQINIDDCQNNSCQSYQVCMDGINSYSCSCPVGMTGLLCESEINECASNPCLNGATCIDGRGNYTCLCNHLNVNLTAISGDPKSIFQIGYTGLRCDQLIDACAYDHPSICLNNGMCILANDSGSFGFACYCPSVSGKYYTGRYCDLRKSACDIAEVSDPPICHFGGTCISVGDNYRCSCAPGYTGSRCKQEINECDSSPCHFNGTCIDRVNGYSCSCIPGTTGVNCETNIDECSSIPCLNDGLCVDLINGYECECNGTGFRGKNCEIDIDECLSHPCLSDATCLNERNMYRCSCHAGYTGTNCEQDIDECLSLPCQNNATCQQRSNMSSLGFSYATAAGYDCVCLPGFTGESCETNINECESSPCFNGSCQDLVNGYSCLCFLGYRGIRCETEINECVEYTPCRNNATCYDKIADYQCVCAMEKYGKVFGGKNCSVELVGCRDNSCQNNATCWPYLKNETSGIHDYSCLCTAGFTGRLCNVSTSASLGLGSWLRLHKPDNVSMLTTSFEFRTTLPDVMLAYFVSDNGSENFFLELVGSVSLKLNMQFRLYRSSVVIESPKQKILTDGEWHKVQLNVTDSDIFLQLSPPNCLLQMNCSSMTHVSLNETLSSGVLYIGGNASKYVESSEDFVGCMRDIEINSEIFIPGGLMQKNVESNNIGIGCLRRDQCLPNPCGVGGRCIDLWTRYRCICSRPFYGTNCSQRHVAATFGYNGLRSYAQFPISPQSQIQLQNFLNISFFFRTRKSSGLLFYVGTGTLELLSNVTFLALELYNRGLRARVKLGDAVSFNSISGDFTDGQKHFVRFLRNHSRLHVTVDSLSSDFTINYSLPLTASALYVGGIPSAVNRKRRETNLPGEPVEDFEGTIEDLELDNTQLLFYPDAVPDSFHLDVINASTMNNVRPGEVTSEICRLRQPCENNATCDDTFFNDFRCNCTDGYTGRNCSLINYCFFQSCPSGSTCKNIADGFECISFATFNGNSSLARYQNTLNDDNVTGISATVRTRKSNGVILHILNQPLSCFLTLGLSDGNVFLRFGLTDYQWSSANLSITDGSFHNISVMYDSNMDQFALFVDGRTRNLSSGGSASVRCSSLLNRDTIVFVGGVARDMVDPLFDVSVENFDYFKGCMSEMRINGILLPFLNQSQLNMRKFVMEKLVSIVTGCLGDDVCGQNNPCENGATCEDIWNAFLCHCAPGFRGTLCSENIDECLQNDCSSNATCIDGISTYTCKCSHGFTGTRCETDINECLSNPCLNNGTCLDHVNGYTCSCTTDYAGNHCEASVQDDCLISPCLNGGSCLSHSSQSGRDLMSCSCVTGFFGKHCETKLDLCANNTCPSNSSTCKELYDTLNYTCVCHVGFTGIHCMDDVNECLLPEPCKNEGNCSNVPGDFLCSCPPSWTGKICEAMKDTSSGGLGSREIAIIVGVIGGSVLLAIVIAVIVFLVIARKKRAMHGTYSPSRHEMAGSRVDMRSALKLPPEERLI